MNRYRIPVRKLRHGPTFVKPKPVLIECSSGLVWQELRPMVRFAVAYTMGEAARTRNPHYLAKQITLRLKSTKSGWRGWAYSRRADIFIGEHFTKPYLNRYVRYQGMPEFWVRDWIEYTVTLTAHELWHIVGTNRHGKDAEFDCELIGSDCLDAWRRFKGYTFIHPPNENTAQSDRELVAA